MARESLEKLLGLFNLSKKERLSAIAKIWSLHLKTSRMYCLPVVFLGSGRTGTPAIFLKQRRVIFSPKAKNSQPWAQTVLAP